MNKLIAILGLSSVSAYTFAAVPADVSTSITTAGTDAATVGGAVLVVLVAIYAFKLMRKAL